MHKLEWPVIIFVLCGWSLSGQAQLISEWRMDESSWNGSAGEVIDSAGGNDGSARTAGSDGSLPDTEPAKVCRGGRFRGQGYNLPAPPWYIDAQHYVQIPDDGSLSPLDSTGDMSIGGWFRMSASGGTLLHKGDGGNSQEYRVHVSGNRLRLELWNRWGGDTSVTLSNQNLTTDTWYFFTASTERLGNSPNVRVRGYLFDENGQIGGVSQDVVSLDYTNKNTSGDLYFGAVSYGFDPVNFFDGTLDELRLYAGVQSAADVAAHWAATRPCDSDGGEAIFSYFMEQTQWTGGAGEVQDSSGNELHATAVGGADTDDSDPAIPGSPGSCRYADIGGTGQRITAGNASLVNDADTFSVAAWVRMPDDLQTTGTPSIIAYGNTVGGQWPERFEVYMERNTGFFGLFDDWVFFVRKSNGTENRFRHRVFSSDGDNPLSGTWVHFVAVYDSGSDEASIYINASLSANGGLAGPSSLSDATGGMGLMAHPGGQYGAAGFIDEVYMFGHALDAGEVSDLYQNTRPCETGYDHIRLIHPTTGLTCSQSAITVQACADVGCTSLYPDPVEIDFTSPAVNWIPDPVSFTGSTQVSLQYTAGGVATLDAAPIDPAAANATRCFTGGGVETNCEMEFFDSGFVIDVPNHVADSSVEGAIAAVRSDPNNPEQCVPGFNDETKDVSFWSQYFDPANGSLQLNIDGSVIATAPPGTTLPIAFDGNGVGDFQLRYADVGNVAVNAEYVGSGDDAGLVMTGQGQFVARPARFTLDIPANPAATDESGDVFTAAGSDFEITVAARNASDGITPNFGQESSPEGVELELTLVAPSGGVEPGLVGSFGPFATDCDGNSATAGTACGEFYWPEVGIISLNPRVASGAYLGTADVVGSQIDSVGRFIPDHFELGSGDIVNRAGLSGCSSSFTYIGERFDVAFTLYARNADGNTTANYEGAFAYLGGDSLNLSGTPTPDINAETVGWVMGVGGANAQLSLPRSSPEAPYPNYEVITAPIDGDGVTLLNPPEPVATTTLHFGRVIIDNAIGSELGPLELPWRAEKWDGSTWLVNDQDNCTTLDLATDLHLTTSAGDSGDGTASVSLGGGTTSIDDAESELTLASGLGSIHFTTPGTPGWVDVLLGLDANWPFLRDDLEAPFGVYEDDPQARATFGLFDGNSQRIYIREIAPQ